VRNGSGNLSDGAGIELPDIETARNYAVGLACELMFGNEARKRHWSLFAHDAEGKESSQSTIQSGISRPTHNG
jgi:hypothetical protein